MGMGVEGQASNFDLQPFVDSTYIDFYAQAYVIDRMGNPYSSTKFHIDDLELSHSPLVEEYSTVETFDHTSFGISIDGSSLTIDPASDLQPETTYALAIASNAILTTPVDQNAAEEYYAGLEGSDSLTFTTAETDTTAPTLVSSNANASAAWALGDNITLTFSENVVANDYSGVGEQADYIYLESSSTYQQFRFDNNNGSTGNTWGGDVTGYGTDTLTFNPGADLNPNELYYFHIPDGF